MLQISLSHINAIVAATDAEALYVPLQSAIELEHSTIPLYFTAYISIKDGASDAMNFIRNTLYAVFVEEMLHMAIACNVLNAIGGQPQINKPDFIPQFPGPLPMVGNFEVHLAPLSEPQLEIFLDIEEPEKGPIHFPTFDVVGSTETRFATFGQFYRALMTKITQLGEGIFKGDPARQVTSVHIPVFANKLSAVTSAAEAVAALQLIVDQGEGTRQSPLEDGSDDLAHYYRFAQIAKGHKLVRNPDVAEGYSYSGDPIAIEPGSIEDMVSDPKLSQFAAGTPAYMAVNDFNAKYCQVLDQLQQVFDGSPDQFGGVAMFAIKMLGQKVVAITDPATGKKAAPSFEYVGVNT